MNYLPKVPLSKLGGMAMRYGYARVSSGTQDYTAQVETLKAAGCSRIYSEKASGKSREGRPEFAKLMKAIQPGPSQHLGRSRRPRRGLHLPRRSMVRHDDRRGPTNHRHHVGDKRV
jgi:hypothetical protein